MNSIATVMYWNPYAFPLPTEDKVQHAFYANHNPSQPYAPLDFQSRLPAIVRECTSDIVILSPVHVSCANGLCAALTEYHTNIHFYGKSDYVVIFAVRMKSTAWFRTSIAALAKSQGYNKAISTVICVGNTSYVFGCVLFPEDHKGDKKCAVSSLRKIGTKFLVPPDRHIIGCGWGNNCAQSITFRKLLCAGFKPISAGALQLAPYDIGYLIADPDQVICATPRAIREFYLTSTEHGKKGQYIWVASQYVMCHKSLAVVSLPTSKTWRAPTWDQYFACGTNADPIWPSWCTPCSFGIL